jgi:hypothetical protein
MPDGSGAGTTNNRGLFISGGSAASNNYAIYSTSAARSLINAQVDIQTTTNTTTAFRVRTSGATNLLTVDTTNEITRINRAADGTLIDLQVAGTSQGSIAVAAGVVSYNAFTGSHYGLFDGPSASTGQLVYLTGNNQYRTGSSEPIYGIAKTTTANSPDVLGAYLSTQNPLVGASLNNPELIMAAGNGEIWIADNGSGNVRIGDPLISSGDVAGHAMRDNKIYAVSYIFAKSAENIDWSTVTAEINGVKVAKVSVLFSYYNQDNITTGLQTQGINVTGLALFGSDVSVTGTMNILGDTTLTNLRVTASAVFEQNLTVQGNVTIAQNLTVTGDTTVQNITVNGKIITAGNTPIAVLGTQATGQGAVTTIAGNDTAGKISYAAGTQALPTNPLAAGAQVAITFATSFSQAPRIALTPKDADSATIRYYVETTPAGFVVHFLDAPSAASAYEFDYIVIQ